MKSRCCLPSGIRLAAGHEFKFEVSFTLTPVNCVYGELYEEYAVSDFREAAERVFESKDQGVFPHYRVYAEGYMPPFFWDVSWPVQRRGDMSDVVPREKIGDAAPWDEKPDDTIVEIWNDPRGVFGFRSVIMLRAGGRTRDEAVANWYTFAKPLRAFFRELSRSNK